MVITRKTTMFALGGVVILFLLIGMIQEMSALEPTPPGGATAPTPRTPQTAQTDRIIVKYRESQMSATDAADRANALSNQLGIPLQLEKIMSGNAQVLKLDRMRNLDEVQDIANRIAAQPGVVYAEPDAIMQIQQAPNDPRYNEQWHYYENAGGINLPAAWQGATGNNVAVAVIDTGIRNHADLAGHILNGYDFITDVPTANDGGGRDADPADPGDWCPPNIPNSSWHGTHVSGTIAAITNNAVGVAGVARNARILPVRVLGKCGGYLSDIVDGMRWAAGMPFPPGSGIPTNPTPARVLNLSLGGSGACGPTYADAINEIRQRGVIVVVAAGNSNADVSQHRPANCAGVIAVAATNRAGGRAYYSNFGSLVTIAASGGETPTRREDGVLSTLNTGSTSPGQDSYAFYQGTSMATPHVAGVVALLYEAKPRITRDEIESILRRTARAFPPASERPCNTNLCGAGIMDAEAAVRNAKPTPIGWLVPVIELLLVD